MEKQQGPSSRCSRHLCNLLSVVPRRVAINHLSRKRMMCPSASITSNPLSVSPTQRANSIDMAPLEWWNRQTRNLPHWLAKFARLSLFNTRPQLPRGLNKDSILNASFSKHQDNALQDYVKTSLMLNTTSDINSLLYVTYRSNMQ